MSGRTVTVGITGDALGTAGLTLVPDTGGAANTTSPTIDAIPGMVDTFDITSVQSTTMEMDNPDVQSWRIIRNASGGFSFEEMTRTGAGWDVLMSIASQ
jgi:hypothetical protein